MDKRNIKWASISLIATFILVAGTISVIMLRGNEDTWLCQNGQWVVHGHPRAPRPTSGCGEDISIPKNTRPLQDLVKSSGFSFSEPTSSQLPWVAETFEQKSQRLLHLTGMSIEAISLPVGWKPLDVIDRYFIEKGWDISKVNSLAHGWDVQHGYSRDDVVCLAVSSEKINNETNQHFDDITVTCGLFSGIMQ